MIATIAGKEFIEMLRDGRFRWAASIVLTLLAFALLAGTYYQRELVAQQRAAQAAEQARWYAQDPKNPHAAAHYGLYGFTLAHHSELRAFFYPRALRKEKFTAWDEVPAFRFVEEPITDVAARVAPALAALVLAALALGLLSWRILARGATDG
jgi:hypothetical protein